MGYEKILFQLGDMDERNVDLIAGTDANPIRINNPAEIFNYLRTGDKSNDCIGYTQERFDDKVEEIVFIGHGTPNTVYALKDYKDHDTSQFVLDSFKWNEFENTTGDFYGGIFEENLEVEFRLCYVGRGEYIYNVAHSLPYKTTVSAYTEPFITKKLFGQVGIQVPSLIGFPLVDKNFDEYKVTYQSFKKD